MASLASLMAFVTWMSREQAGERFTPRTGMNKYLLTALLSLSGQYPTRQTYCFMGWTQVDEHCGYVTPSLTVGADGTHEQAPEVELETRLRDYGLHKVEWTQSLVAPYLTLMTEDAPQHEHPLPSALSCLPQPRGCRRSAR